MKNLRRLGVSVILTAAIGLSTLAVEAQTPSCAPPEPGQSSTPPCVANPANTPPGDISAPTIPENLASEANQASLDEIAVSVLLSLLPLF